MEPQRLGTFLLELSSATPVPGGGGASAYVGALGAALGLMVCNLTIGKKKYVDVQSDIEILLKELQAVTDCLVDLIKKDELDFQPLAKAYRLPKDHPDYDEVMARALTNACQAPIKIMTTAIKGLELHEAVAKKGNRMALSDIGVGVQFLKAAINGASLNIYINARSMRNHDEAKTLIAKTDELACMGNELADRIYAMVREELR